MVERFYLLSPATSYAGEYIWQGDAKTGCERILRDTGIAKEEWQMGTTKAFIKNPETVSSSPLRLASILMNAAVVVRSGAYARSILAQYGWSNSTSMEELYAIQE